MEVVLISNWKVFPIKVIFSRVFCMYLISADIMEKFLLPVLYVITRICSAFSRYRKMCEKWPLRPGRTTRRRISMQFMDLATTDTGCGRRSVRHVLTGFMYSPWITYPKATGALVVEGFSWAFDTETQAHRSSATLQWLWRQLKWWLRWLSKSPA